MDSRIGRTIIIRGFTNPMDGEFTGNRLTLRFDDYIEIKTLGEITLKDIKNLSRLFNRETAFLIRVGIKELNEKELTTLDKIGFDVEIGTQILALKVVE